MKAFERQELCHLFFLKLPISAHGGIMPNQAGSLAYLIFPLSSKVLDVFRKSLLFNKYMLTYYLVIINVLQAS